MELDEVIRLDGSSEVVGIDKLAGRGGAVKRKMMIGDEEITADGMLSPIPIGLRCRIHIMTMVSTTSQLRTNRW